MSLHICSTIEVEAKVFLLSFELFPLMWGKLIDYNENFATWSDDLETREFPLDYQIVMAVYF